MELWKLHHITLQRRCELGEFTEAVMLRSVNRTALYYAGSPLTLQDFPDSSNFDFLFVSNVGPQKAQCLGVYPFVIPSVVHELSTKGYQLDV